MEKIFQLLIVCALIGCAQNEDAPYFNDIKEYQGVWRDTIFANNDIYIEDLKVSDHSISYELTNANTNIVWDKFTGLMEIGNENKIRWNCVSSITNKIRQTHWNVLNLSTYQMNLYSNIQGEHVYRRVYSPYFETYEIEDTLEELYHFKNYMPLSKDAIIDKFGSINRLSYEADYSYLINNPLFEKVCFKPNCNNDSIYSYILCLRKDNTHSVDWNSFEKYIGNSFSKIRELKGIQEYCDSKSIERSSSIFILDPSSRQITVSPLKDYDYWPNGLHFIGRTLQDVKEELGSNYVYTYYEYPDSDLVQYDYQTSHDGVCRIISICTGSDEIVSRSAIWLLGNNTMEQEALVLHLLHKKYYYDRHENDIYYFYSDKDVDSVSYEVRYMPSRNVIMYFSKFK